MTQQNRPQRTPKNFLKTAKIIHLALAMGCLAISAYFYSNTDMNFTDELNLKDPMIYILPVIGAIAFFASSVLYRNLIDKAKTQPSLLSKLNGFLSANIVRYAIIEGATLINIIWFSTTGTPLYITVAGTLLIYLFWLRPTKDKIIEDLALRGQDKAKFEAFDQDL
ncbi:hypothetical protein [Croceivirga radicis]|uniref:hypothetical protein n=1 Tax=Croceivirga radicis TaxID=1929488 RepID=UPI000255B541|nr:hypothetical protein [Croceivirga radicis]